MQFTKKICLFFSLLAFFSTSYASMLDDFEQTPPSDRGIYKLEGEDLRRKGLFVLGCTKAMPEHCENTASALCSKLGFTELSEYESTPAFNDSLQLIEGFSTDDSRFVKLVRTETTANFEEVEAAFMFQVVFLTSLTCELK